MSCKVISGGGFTLCPKQNQPTKLSTIESCSSLSIGAKSTRPPSQIFIKQAPVSCRRIAAKASTMDATYALTQTMETFYDLLGIPESGTLSEIKKAYKLLARKYHPDVSPPDRIEEHTRRFIMVQEAYETLCDPKSRALYDRDLANGLICSARKGSQNYQGRGVKNMAEWKCRWQSQLDELKRRSMNKNSRGKTSWGAQMRRQQDV